MIALFAVVAGALAGPLVGAVVGLAGGGVFYVTVAGHGAGPPSRRPDLDDDLAGGRPAVGSARQGAARTDGAAPAGAVALARADAAREAQLAEQAHIEELASGLQLQTDALTERAGLAEALNTINTLVHSTLDFGDVSNCARQGCCGPQSRCRHDRAWEDESWVVAYQHGFSDERPNCATARAGTDRLSSAGDATARSPSPTWNSRRRLPPASPSPRVSESCPGRAPGRARGGDRLPAVIRTQAAGFSRAEIDFARQLGVTVSLAVDNARLYVEQRRIAQTLQENFIHEFPVGARPRDRHRRAIRLRTRSSWAVTSATSSSSTMARSSY